MICALCGFELGDITNPVQTVPREEVDDTGAVLGIDYVHAHHQTIDGVLYPVLEFTP